MAEERPRPGAEEDSDEAEEGEEAAEVPEPPVIEAKEGEGEGEEAAVPEERVEAPLPPPPPPAEPQPLPPAEPQPPPPAQPLLPRASLLPLPRPSLLGAFPQTMPEPSPAPPFLYSTPVVMYSPQPVAAPAPSTATTSGGVNIFANDGSFMEIFKKTMESCSKEEPRPVEEEKKPEPERRKPISFVGKRRGGAKLALKTGMVAKKPKSEDEEVLSRKGGAWAQYMAEVKKYKAHQCSDDDKTRPLVK